MEPGFTIFVTSPVVLAAITGRQQQCGLTRITLFPEKGNRFSVGQGEAFALVHPRRMVAYSNNLEGYFRQHPTTLRRFKLATIRVSAERTPYVYGSEPTSPTPWRGGPFNQAATQLNASLRR